MARLNDQLLAHARGGKYRPSPVALPQLLRDTLDVLRPGLNPQVEVATDFQTDISLVMADVSQIQMIFSAVLNNAFEAVDGSGHIKISLRQKGFDAAYAGNHPGLNPGKYVVLKVEDDGKGMDDDTQGRIFEPFYTTKHQGRGLGMAAVYGIVKNHDGWIGVESVSGEGTCVRILLPVLTDVLQEDKKKIIADVVKGPGTILIIDDEDDVQEVSRTILERLGYGVLEARTGEEAIEIAANFDQEIDLAILDIGLPDIPGEQLFRKIKEIRPAVKILVSTGYAVEDIVDNLKREAQGFIQKPISYSKLSTKIKEILGD